MSEPKLKLQIFSLVNRTTAEASKGVGTEISSLELVSTVPNNKVESTTEQPQSTPRAVHQQQEEEEGDSTPPNLGTPHHDDSSGSGTPPIFQNAGSHRPEDVRLWTVNHVAEWLREQGNFEKEAELLRQQDIDGTSLLLLKSMSVITAVGIKIGPAVKIFERIKRLKARQEALSSTRSS